MVEAYEFLAKFKMGWYKSLNSKGKEIKTFGGLISTPSYDKEDLPVFNQQLLAEKTLGYSWVQLYSVQFGVQRTQQ